MTDDNTDRIQKGPLKGKRIELAPQVGIKQYEDLVELFCRKILYDVVDIDGGLPLLTDESSLWDFTGFNGTEPDLGDLMFRIEKEFGVSCDDIDPPNFLKVFERLRLHYP